MSDYIYPTELDHLDDKTGKIVYGYIRQAEKLLSSPYLNYIPSDIILTTLLYVDDHFMFSRGSYQWFIKDIKPIFDSSLSSSVFEIGGLYWMMQTKPNDRDDELVDLQLQLLSLPDTFQTVIILWTVINEETNTRMIQTERYSGINQSKAWKGSLTHQELHNIELNGITFTCSITILRITSRKMVIRNNENIFYQSPVKNYKKKYKIQWKLDTKTICKGSDNWDYGKEIVSNVFHDIFCFVYVPDHSYVTLQLCGLPRKYNELKDKWDTYDKIRLKWTFSIPDTSVKVDTVGTVVLHPQSESNSIIISLDPQLFAFDYFKMRSQVIFCNEIHILAQYDVYGVSIGDDAGLNTWKKLIDEQKTLSKPDKQKPLNQIMKTLMSVESEQKTKSDSDICILDNNYMHMYADYDFLDKNTHLIVYGYIRQILSANSSEIVLSANEILSHVNDYFMFHRGWYQWNIKDSLLIKIKKAIKFQKFMSDVFEIANLRWVMSLYPNGHPINSCANEFVMDVSILSFPTEWQRIDVCVAIKILETNTNCLRVIKIYRPSSIGAWILSALSVNEFYNIIKNKLTIILSIKIIRIHQITVPPQVPNLVKHSNQIPLSSDCIKIIKYQSSIDHYQKRYQFNFVFDKNMINKRQHWNLNKVYQSRIFGDLFCFEYFPLAITNQISLMLCGLPHQINGKNYFVDALDVKWTVHVHVPEILNATFVECKRLSFKEFEDILSLTIQIFSIDSFNAIDCITFCNDIEILSEYDVNGNLIGTTTNKEWDYFIQMGQENANKMTVSNSKNIDDIYPGATSNSINIINNDYLDEETKIIVSGYIREISLGQVTSEIFYITLAYVDDHFIIYRGSYEWKIDNRKILNQLITADKNQCFPSDAFEIGNLKWILLFVPKFVPMLDNDIGNELNDSHNVTVGLRLLSIPPKWKEIIAAVTIHCMETGVEFADTYVWSLDNLHFQFGWLVWPAGAIKYTEFVKIIKQGRITFVVSIKILRVYSNNEKPELLFQAPLARYKKCYQFNWKLSKQMMSHETRSTGIFDDMFCISFSKELPIRITFTLKLCGLPINVDTIQIKWRIDIIEADITDCTVAMVNLKKSYILYSVSPYVWSNICKYKCVNVCNIIEILSECDIDGNIIGIDMYAGWDKYIVEKKESDHSNDETENVKLWLMNEVKRMRHQLLSYNQQLNNSSYSVPRLYIVIYIVSMVMLFVAIYFG